MKADDLKMCRICGKGMAHAGHITFWTLSIQRMGLMRDSIQRVAAMEMHFGGNLPIARVFNDEDVAVAIGDAGKIFVCETCATKTIHCGVWGLLPVEPTKEPTHAS